MSPRQSLPISSEHRQRMCTKQPQLAPLSNPYRCTKPAALLASLGKHVEDELLVHYLKKLLHALQLGTETLDTLALLLLWHVDGGIDVIEYSFCFV